MVGAEFLELLVKFFYFKYANSSFSQRFLMVGDALIFDISFHVILIRFGLDGIHYIRASPL